VSLRNDSRKQATALTYDTKNADAAPRVVAKGYGLVAEMIVQRAKDAGLYVHESPEMVVAADAGRPGLAHSARALSGGGRTARVVVSAGERSGGGAAARSGPGNSSAQGA